MILSKYKNYQKYATIRGIKRLLHYIVVRFGVVLLHQLLTSDTIYVIYENKY